MGVELNGSELRYVVLHFGGEGHWEMSAANRLVLTHTRSGAALSAVQSAITTTLNEATPDLLAIKAKPESGQMRAGAAALKLEALLLASASCEVDFVSGSRVNKVGEDGGALRRYLVPAFKTALAAAAAK
jgi:hypothetical protein